ncbi:SPOR domain-containing protein [Prolixibacter denitrificans]|uniref:Sporulation related protein n=1 Tax=Prolixibacter denitrificans TaxID=1541063 RepID=A0A2P8CH47_9BACT|nr:SPOR domain-containing protein [Prolixibacter denitrificans]PSK84232.1 sporulation related protein [Prolixibacter denitrificans]GET20406.1 hypothetical protein JCM18694_06520 [Prolixibacter denitrificans]
MKILKIFFILSLAFVFGCKTQHLMPETTTPEQMKEPETTKIDNAPKIVVKEEKVSVPDGEEKSLDSKRFYVILGSFGVYQNAQKFKNQLMHEGFYPGILVNENGLYRVCVDSYDDENTARQKVTDIRDKYKQFRDAWLLIKKEN